jgi:hypothetical protein
MYPYTWLLAPRIAPFCVGTVANANRETRESIASGCEL